MESINLAIARRIAPEFIEVIQSRARILERIRLFQPIGRRALAAELGISERILRAEVDFLKQQGLLHSRPSGMSLTDEGESLLDHFDTVMASLEGRARSSELLSKRLGIPKVIVVGGDSDVDSWVKDTLGYQAATYLRSVLVDGDVLAVTGGTTIAAIAKMMPRKHQAIAVKVVPARGGLGENVAVQANTVAAEMAEHLGGTSMMLHVPDRVSDETMQRLVSEPMVQQPLSHIRRASVVVHGIGEAIKMARRRHLSVEEVESLTEEGAVAEAFGYYFDSEGNSVHVMTTVGLQLADLENARLVMAAAGGASKAEAIAAAAKAYRIDVLITDEGAAKRMTENRDGGVEHGSESGN